MSTWFRRLGFAEVHQRLIVGAVPLDEGDVRMLARLGVTRILNLVEDREYGTGARARVEEALDQAGIEELRLSTEDYGNLPASLLDRAVTVIDGWISEGQLVYLHCRAGWQRSATVAGAVVAAREAVSADEALGRIRARKPSADPLPHQKEDLRAWYEGRQIQAAER